MVLAANRALRDGYISSWQFLAVDEADAFQRCTNATEEHYLLPRESDTNQSSIRNNNKGHNSYQRNPHNYHYGNCDNYKLFQEIQNLVRTRILPLSCVANKIKILLQQQSNRLSLTIKTLLLKTYTVTTWIVWEL
jgi:hypothetical protein